VNDPGVVLSIHPAEIRNTILVGYEISAWVMLGVASYK
jgi:hypothetical protein